MTTSKKIMTKVLSQIEKALNELNNCKTSDCNQSAATYRDMQILHEAKAKIVRQSLK